MKGRVRWRSLRAVGARGWPRVAVCLGLWAAACARGVPAPTAAKATPVTTYRVGLGAVAHAVEAIGHVEGWQSAEVRPEVDGRLVALHFRDGEQVAAGALLAEVDPRLAAIAVATAQAAVDGGVARSALSRLALDRQKRLRAANLNAEADLDLARATLDGDVATLASARAGLDQARLTLSRAQVRAPFAGIIGIRRLSAGNLVRAADANAVLATLVQLDPAAVLVSLPENAVAEVRQAMAEGRRDVDLYARDGDRRLARGALWGIDNQIQPASGTARIKVRADNPDGSLWPGQFVRARLTLAWRDGVPVVPREAVGRGEGAVVWTVGEGARAAERIVETGAEAGGWVEIRGGVGVGEEVVLVGQHLLRPGAQVRPTAVAEERLPPRPMPP